MVDSNSEHVSCHLANELKLKLHLQSCLRSNTYLHKFQIRCNPLHGTNFLVVAELLSCSGSADQTRKILHRHTVPVVLGRGQLRASLRWINFWAAELYNVIQLQCVLTNHSVSLSLGSRSCPSVGESCLVHSCVWFSCSACLTCAPKPLIGLLPRCVALKL